jgi:4-hydroxybutyrate CoA-transferase
VTTPRYLAAKVVTEYGVADLRDRPFRERAEALIQIAHPSFRDQLTQQLKERYA